MMRTTVSALLLAVLAASAVASDLEHNKDLVRRFVSATNERRLDALDEMAAAAAATGGEAPEAASEEAKKALARRWFDEVINGRDLGAVDEIDADG